MSEAEVLAKYSTPGLQRNELTRSVKKLNMEFDERFRDMTKQDRDVFLDQYYPEK